VACLRDLRITSAPFRGRERLAWCFPVATPSVGVDHGSRQPRADEDCAFGTGVTGGANFVRAAEVDPRGRAMDFGSPSEVTPGRWSYSAAGSHAEATGTCRWTADVLARPPDPGSLHGGGSPGYLSDRLRRTRGVGRGFRQRRRAVRWRDADAGIGNPRPSARRAGPAGRPAPRRQTRPGRRAPRMPESPTARVDAVSSRVPR